MFVFNYKTAMKLINSIFLAILLIVCCKCPFLVKYCRIFFRLIFVQFSDSRFFNSLVNRKQCLIGYPKMFAKDGTIQSSRLCDFCTSNSTAAVWYVSFVYYEKHEKFLLLQDTPFVVGASGDFSNRIENVSQVLGRLHGSDPCSLRTNLIYSSFTEILQTAASNEKLSYYLSFENCDRDKMKEVRYHYLKNALFSRSLTVSVATANWILLHENFKTNKWIAVGTRKASMAVVHQVFGRTHWKLEPHQRCKQFCAVQKLFLSPGQLLFVSTFWRIYYRPAERPGLEKNFAFISEHDLLV